MDESGVDEELSRSYGRAPRGQRVEGERAGQKPHRLTVIAAYNDERLKAPFRFEGYTNTEVFNTWLQQCLVPVLRPGQTVILDNARFHQSASTPEFVQQAQCQLLFLPPYSPDLNPIEHQWATLKARLRRHPHSSRVFPDLLDQELLQLSKHTYN